MAEEKKIRVMVAEDMPLLREDCCDTVDQQEDMEIVGSAASGQEICALAREKDCDVILMDIEMETMQAGIVAAEAIHQSRRCRRSCGLRLKACGLSWPMRSGTCRRIWQMRMW